MSRYRLRLAKDPDGDGPLAAHATEGDGFTVLQEYRGFQFGTEGHRRLSPARKNLLVEADNMAGYAGAASSAEVADAMAVARAAFLASAGAQLDYVLDEENAAYADFNSASAVASYRAAHKRTKELNNTIYYDRFRYLLFCEKSYDPIEPYGQSWPSERFALVYCGESRSRSATLSKVNAAATVGQCLGHTATHELGHCVGASHTAYTKKALRLSYAPLSTGEYVSAARLAVIDVLTLDRDPAHAPHDISLLTAESDTIAELATEIGKLAGYSATILNGSGNQYSYAIPLANENGGGCIVRVPPVNPDEDVLSCRLDQSVMEVVTVLNAVVSTQFANSGSAADNETRVMNFK